MWECSDNVLSYQPCAVISVAFFVPEYVRGQERPGALLRHTMSEAARAAAAALGADGLSVRERATLRRREQAANARACKAERQEKAAAGATAVAHETLTMVVACLPGAAAMLGQSHAAAIKNAREPSMIRLAVSPAIRGSGAAIESCRSLQQLGQTVVAEVSLARQAAGLEMWKNRDTKRGDADALHIRGVNFLWDEASQNLRAMSSDAGGKESKGQTVQHVLVPQTAVYQSDGRMTPEGPEFRIEFQPWLSGPAFLSTTKHGDILEGLRRTLPVDLTSKDSVLSFGKNATICIFTMTYDSASSNLAALRCFNATVSSAGSDYYLLHGERCAAHMFHAVKAKTITRCGFDGAIFSMSKIVKHGKSMQGWLQCLHALVEKKMRVRFYDGAVPPLVSPLLLAAAREILGIMEDAEDHDGRVKLNVSWRRKVNQMFEKCPFCVEAQEWIVWKPRGSSIELPPVKDFCAPIAEVFVHASWQDGALTRWTGVMANLSKIVLGAMCNGILISSLAGLAGNMGLTQMKIDSMMLDIAMKRARGEDADDTWCRHCSRVVKLSVSLGESTRRWQCGIALAAACVIDALHWHILGNRKREKARAQLIKMCGMHTSVVGAALTRVVHELDDWNMDSPTWAVLPFLGSQTR